MGGWNASSLWTGGPKEKTIKIPFSFIKSFPMLKLLINLKYNYHTLGIV